MNLLRIFSIVASFSVASGFLGIQRSKSGRHSPLSQSASDAMPEVKVGDEIPSITLSEGLADFGKQDVDIKELIAGKTVAIFGVPGAFTPGCSKSHLPSFIEAQDELKSKGVDMTICIATNDLYVMEVCGN